MKELAEASNQNAVEVASAFRGYTSAKEPRSHDEVFARVGPGTPAGEYLRRFWHPVARTEQVLDVPLPLRRFGEDLILFRDLSGRLGLVHRNCPHRNASLEFGIIQQHGIRCCYHGWHFDIDGSLLEAPAERSTEAIANKLCLGAYPVREYRGLVFAYLGPPAEMPEFPIYDTFEIEDGELLPYEVTLPCNWVQVTENSMDPMHVVFLHTRVNRVQFTEKLGILPILNWHERPIGFFYTKGRRVDDVVWISTNDLILPNFTQAGCVYNNTNGLEPKYFGRNSFTRWVVPVDDENTIVLAFRHFNERAEAARDEWRTAESLERIDISELKNRPYEERQRNPGDYEAFIGQGSITPHATEHLVSSDVGVARFRRRLKDEIKRVAEGARPVHAVAVHGNPVPTYGSDTVIRMPARPGVDDEDAIRKLQINVGRIYQSGDSIRGEARYDFLAGELSALNR